MVAKAVESLLRWFPRGQGGQKMVKVLVKQIELEEEELRTLRDNDMGTLSESCALGTDNRLRLLRRSFETCDVGDKGFLAMTEFVHLLLGLGVVMVDSELDIELAKLRRVCRVRGVERRTKRRC